MKWRKPLLSGAISFRGEPQVKRDDEVTDADAAANNLILWGDPHSNKLIGRIADKTTDCLGARRRSAWEKEFRFNSSPAGVDLSESPACNQYVVRTADSFAHPRSTSNADQTPKLPDYAVVDIDGRLLSV